MLNIVILAAGEGKRMRSRLPKVLHALAGKPLLEWVVRAVQGLANSQLYIVTGFASEQIHQQLNHLSITWIKQAERLGTGHAVTQAVPYLQEDHDKVLILFGDVPLISTASLESLLDVSADLVLATTEMADPSGLGRILRNAQGKVIGIIEEKDATSTQREINEVYAGIMLTTVAKLKKWLPQLSCDNAQQEYYLTDIVKIAVSEQCDITGIAIPHSEVQGINDRVQLAALERQLQQQQVKQLMMSGVTVRDPARLDIRGDLDIANDVTLDINVILEGKVKIGAHSYIGPNVVLRNIVLGEHSHVYANSVLEDAEIGHHCTIGPFARIRPGTQIQDYVKIGNFVEVKQASIGQYSKVNHLSYIGDATIGNKVNVGAGTITCNFDGIAKHKTIIGDNAFIGSNSQLVAPVTIGEGATIGAGSTITHDAPSNALTLSRSKQQTIKAWRKPVKRES
jgi:bifunctional UDP-N-acetylglucosamine pyrophosphorylase/glucosamine-1-phosphate N-acetyltransferase